MGTPRDPGPGCDRTVREERRGKRVVAGLTGRTVAHSPARILTRPHSSLTPPHSPVTPHSLASLANLLYAPLAHVGNRKPGDFGFDPLMLLKSPNADKYYLSELIHGRAAMIAFSAVVTQSGLNAAFGYGKVAFPYF